MKTDRLIAIITGVAILLMAVVAIYAYAYVHSTLVVEGNPRATGENLRTSITLFRSGVFAWLVILILDIVVAWGLYIFFKPVNKSLSLLTAWFRLAYVVILGAAMINFIYVLNILKAGSIIPLETANQQLMFYLNSFESYWSFGLIIFGIHLMLLAFLVLKDRQIHRFFGIMLIIAALSYMIIHTSRFLVLTSEEFLSSLEMVLSIPMAFGEIALAIWLIVRGGRKKLANKSQ
jgi:Domain of unknown function (DUF4386)